MTPQSNQNIFTVSRLNSEVRLLLENEMGIVWLVGEISNFSTPVSGHWYLTLKDSRAQVKCAMFRGNNRRVTFKPQNGNQVLVRARLSLYEPRGDYQLIIESMQPEGDGLLQKQFEELKMRMAGEGLFAQANKAPLPEHPRCIGVVTSKTGAALHDILDVLKRRDPSLPVVIYPTLVQGDEASIQIAQAIGRANARQECDVLIVGRGGGSLEDLWCFNNEIVARTIAASQIPIVSAVGHEVDVTIADFVADVRAPTPSAAAELVSQDTSYKTQTIKASLHRLRDVMHRCISKHQQTYLQLQHRLDKQHPSYKLQVQAQQIDELDLRLRNAMHRHLSDSKAQVQHYSYQLRLNSPVNHLAKQRARLESNEQKLSRFAESLLTHSKHRLAMAAEKLETVSPLATLKRGYSITQSNDNKVITSHEQVTLGEKIVTKVEDGEIYSTVEATKAS
ncbi:exodeoxyribonuclease VII large subunit [Vibrio marisflavi]|uniref:Exodeoxyribonuclease 7 large subunit n=1 Tax=Vibrio marisflavi CECT 7928 TaxID=634439 RepID=A0ABN8E461_9VIBR|nr:exodeoxyribonuclease VII large subunit [Vibrio marisflavi]CAH0538836.1 Exodeoxyribonuclease 7 large subunit [Vibrio marisflavi CECT 7928]